jgi:hypothetical protein
MSLLPPQTYSFLNGTLTINGRPMTDFADGDDVIQARRLEDSSSHVVGADGSMAISISGNLSGEIIFRLKQTSGDAGFLYNLVNAGQVGRVSTVGAVVFRDSRRKDQFVGVAGYVSKPADFVRGNGVNVQEWRIVVSKLMITQPDLKNDLLGKIGDSIGI